MEERKIRTKYDEIVSMPIGALAYELLKVATWDRNEIKKAEKSPGGLYGFILDVLETPLPDICKDCKAGEWYIDNGKCERCELEE